MRHTRGLLSVLALLLGALALSGSAFAGDGVNGNGNGGTPPGQGGTPPGQEKKAETAPPPAAQPAQPARPAQAAPAAHPAPKKPAKEAAKAVEHAAKAAKHEAKAAKHEAKHAQKAAAHQQEKAASQSSASHGKSAEAHHHVIICHATGSATNPYVVVNISVRGWQNGHSKHDGDKLLQDPAAPGEKGPDKSACGTPAAAAAGQASQASQAPQGSQDTATCAGATTTVTERVLVGVWHHTGSKTNPYVFITPSAHSAHLTGKHPDDIPVYQDVVRTATTATGATCTAATAGTATAAAPAGSVAGVAAVLPTAIDYPANVQGMPVYVAAAAPVQGGVAGVSATLRKPAKSGALAATATPRSGTLPFTGLQLLGFAIAGVVLVAAGLMLRRRAAAQRLTP